MSRFIYVTFIRTTAAKLWDALTLPEFTRAYWHGVTQDSTWEKGAAWKMQFADGTVADSGKILESDRPRRLVIEWTHQIQPELTAEGASRCTYELHEKEGIVRLRITHEIEVGESRLIAAVSTGWPSILASLKSLLETGQPLPATRDWPD
jgi:uncharacterized protein YndB with AHSA1/START domain